MKDAMIIVSRPKRKNDIVLSEQPEQILAEMHAGRMLLAVAKWRNIWSIPHTISGGRAPSLASRSRANARVLLTSEHPPKLVIVVGKSVARAFGVHSDYFEAAELRFGMLSETPVKAYVFPQSEYLSPDRLQLFLDELIKELD